VPPLGGEVVSARRDGPQWPIGMIPSIEVDIVEDDLWTLTSHSHAATRSRKFVGIFVRLSHNVADVNDDSRFDTESLQVRPGLLPSRKTTPSMVWRT
jgi:hypothetical protein